MLSVSVIWVDGNALKNLVLELVQFWVINILKRLTGRSLNFTVQLVNTHS